MKNINIKKLVLLNLPYALIGLYATKLGQAWRLAAHGVNTVFHGGERCINLHPAHRRATRGLKTRNTGRPVFDEEYGCSECGSMIHGLAETEAVAWWGWRSCCLRSFLRWVSSSR